MRDEEKTKEQLICELITLRQILYEISSLHKVENQHECLPVCADCKKIRNEQGLWQQVEDYLNRRYGLDFTHTFCPDCLKHRHLEVENYFAAVQNL